MTELSIRLHGFIVSTIASVMNRGSEERGQDLIEYAMLAGLIALAIIGAVVIFNGALLNLSKGIANCIDFNNSTVCSPGF